MLNKLKTCLLIDGSPLIFRGYYATPKNLATSYGFPTNALLTATISMLKIRSDFEPDYLAVALDPPKEDNPLARRSFRDGILPSYKGTRSRSPPELLQQLDKLEEACEALSIPTVRVVDYEADDILASYARIASLQAPEPHRTIVVTSDKDLHQLISPNVSVWDPIKKKLLGIPEFQSLYNIDNPASFPHYQALAGDRADNIPSVPGIGPKRAAYLLNNFGDTLPKLYGSISSVSPIDLRERLKAYSAAAHTSLKLTTLVDNIDPLPLSYDQLATRELDPIKLATFAEKYELKSILRQLAHTNKEAPLQLAITDNQITLGSNNLNEHKNNQQNNSSYDDDNTSLAPPLGYQYGKVPRSSAWSSSTALTGSDDNNDNNDNNDDDFNDDDFNDDDYVYTPSRALESVESKKSNKELLYCRPSIPLNRNSFPFPSSLAPSFSHLEQSLTSLDNSILSSKALLDSAQEDYYCVSSHSELELLVSDIKRKGRFSFSTILSDSSYHDNPLIGISVTTEPGLSFYIPIIHSSPAYWPEDLVEQERRESKMLKLREKIARQAQREAKAEAKRVAKAAAKSKGRKVSSVTAEEIESYLEPVDEGEIEQALAEAVEADAYLRGGSSGSSLVPASRPRSSALCTDSQATDRTLSLLRPLFESPSVIKIVHNSKEARQHLARASLPFAGPFEDVMVMAYVLYCGKHSTSLESLTSNYLPGKTLVPIRSVTGAGKTKLPLAESFLEHMTLYACQRSDASFRLFHSFYDTLSSNATLWWFYYRLELPLASILSGVESGGVCVDASVLSGLSNELAARLEALSEKIYEVAGSEFNIYSSQQLGEVLFGGGKNRKFMKASPKTGAPKTGEEVLKKMAESGEELAALVLAHRATAKIKSTYADGLREEIRPSTGRIHTTYMNCLTQSGRLSSQRPNLQNIPNRVEEGRKIRAAFVASPDSILLAADYSQVELRIFAEMADIGSLKEAFLAGTDVHSLTASQVFGVPVEQVDKATRQKAKAINFGIIYGMSEYGLSASLGVSIDEARAYIKSYFQQYPGISKYMSETKSKCREKGYVETLYGRRCWIPAIHGGGPAANGAERVAINTPIQGTSADITKIAMLKLAAAFREYDLKTRMILQVHDEIVFDAKKSELEVVRPLIVELMESAAPDSFEVPLPVEIGEKENWFE